MKYYKLCLAAILLLNSCSVYKEYVPATTMQEDLFGVISSDTTSSLSPDWKVLFNDPCLQSLIDTALIYNSDYGIAQLRSEQASAALGAARLAYLPSLGFETEGNVAKYGGDTSLSFNLGLNSSWEIDIFGKLTAAKRGAAAAAVKADEEAQAVKSQLIATVAESYFSLLILDRRIEIARSTLDNWTETIRVMELLKTAGMAREPGILQAKANKLALLADISTMERNIREIENSLCTLTGQTPHKIERGSIENLSFPLDLSPGLPIQLLSNRPDVRAAEMEMARTWYATGEARAAFYPSISLGGTIGFTNNGGIIVNPAQWLLNAVGQIMQPIFSRGQLKANYRIAEAERDIAKIRFSQVLLDAGKEVNNALTAIESARERMSLAEEQIRTLKEAVDKTEMLMRHSPTNYLEVLTAQQSLLNARQEELQCRHDEISGIISLFHALGGIQ